ncbi:MAG: LPXTG cell wall anchor domain-containing protein [Actinomycetota bacterium]|nr:LPXTG cell wall anchor domain-containing protein [Actinomycetota bacterium]
MYGLPNTGLGISTVVYALIGLVMLVAGVLLELASKARVRR